VDILTGTGATHDAVLEALTGAQWAHFACHGHSDLADPSTATWYWPTITTDRSPWWTWPGSR
jgi:hypothetical protein